MTHKNFSSNSYEIIRKYDLGKYNEKINKFKDKTWNEVIISEVININNSNLTIKDISKIYVSVKILSSKIIDTSESDTPNMFGTKLTGKMLLVNGEICENIVYTSDTLAQSVNCYKIKTFFNTYIMIDKNSDNENDRYCVYPYVEFVSVRFINEKNLSNSVHVFLFANKVEKVSQIIYKIQNVIFLNDENDEEMIRVKFDNLVLKLKILSTDKKAPKKYIADSYFTFKLIRDIENYDYVESNISGDEDGTKFRDELDNIDFNTNDVIEINYKEGDKVIIDNFPNIGNRYNPNLSADYFKITVEKLEKFKSALIENIIVFKDSNNQEIGSIGFDIFDKKFKVQSNQNKIDLKYSREQYFSLEVFNSKFCFVQEHIKINGDEDLKKLVQKLNGEFLNYDYVFLFKYIENPKIEINNYPIKGETYLLTEKEENFKLTLNGLKKHIKMLKNFMHFEVNGLLASIGFDKESKRLIAKSTGIIENNPNPINNICKVEIYTNNNLISVSDLEFNKTSDEFAKKLDNIDFEYYKTYVKITYYETPNVLKIYDYLSNNGEQTETNIPNFQNKKFMITPFGILPNGLENIIIVNNNNNQEIVKIVFNIEDKKIFVTSTNNISDIALGNQEYFILDLKDSNGKRKIKKEIKGLEGGIDLQKLFLNQPFEFDDIVSLVCLKSNKIMITNFPNSSTPIYIPIYKKVNFKIKRDLLEILNLFENTIILNDENNEEMVRIDFEISTLKLEISSTNKKAPKKYLADIYFEFKLINDIEVYGYVGSNILGNEDATKLRSDLNKKSFNFNNLVELNYKENDKVIVENFPITNNKYNPKFSATYFNITPNGLENFDSNLLNNSIVFKNINNLKLGEIFFDIYNKKFKVQFNLEKIDLNYSEEQYFSLEIFNNKFGFIQEHISIKGNEDLEKLDRGLNNESLDFNYAIFFKYIENPKIEIINYPNQANKHVLTNKCENFKLTLNGLKSYPKMLDNFMYFEHNELLSTIGFNKEREVLVVKSTGLITNQLNPRNFICKVEVYNDNTLIKSSNLEFNKNANDFEKQLNNLKFEYYKTEIQITYYETSNILKIYNYHNNNGRQTEISLPNFQIKKFIITSFGIIPYGLKNIIIVENKNNQEMLNIVFENNVNVKSLFIRATENVSNLNLGSIEYFSLEIKNSFNVRKIFDQINGNENALNFQNNLNNTNFEFGDVLTLKYNDNSKIKITNFPNSTNPIYTPKNSEESFIITQNGFVLKQ